MSWFEDLRVPEPISPATPAATVLEMFDLDPALLLIAVVDPQRRPVGLVDRNCFMRVMAGEFGYALNAKHPIGQLMDQAPLIVDRSVDVAEVTSAVLSTASAELVTGFIVVRDGVYTGVGTSLDLLRLVHRRLIDSAAQIERDKIFMERVVEAIPVMLTVKSAIDGRILFVNRAAETGFGHKREDVVGRRSEDIFPLEQAAGFMEQDRALLASGEPMVIENEHLPRIDGTERWLSTRKLTIPDETGAQRWIVRVSEDVTERRREQARIEHLAHCDALTGLSNRTSFHQHLAAALSACPGASGEVAVLCIDLDRFKSVNDRLGHDAGDALLRQAAERLRACTRAGDQIARLGGDEFAVVIRQVPSDLEIRSVAGRIVAAFAQPFPIGDEPVSIGASVGYALYPSDAEDIEQLLKCADVALYRAKASGRSCFEAFTDAMRSELTARHGLESELREAIEQDQLVLHYQPLIEPATGRLRAFEALVRWNHPRRGLIMPGEFIALAETAGSIVPLGRWVLRNACLQAASWHDEIGISVNISPLQFRDPQLTEMIASALQAAGLRPGRLELEITESVLLDDDDANVETLYAIKRLGCRVALDDFGTGFSSLGYLRRFPFDKIKIDRAFVKDLPQNDSSFAIIRSVAALARALSMVVTAEGVETAAQLAEVTKAGCDEVQGYLLGRPMPTEQISRLDRPATGTTIAAPVLEPAPILEPAPVLEPAL